MVEGLIALGVALVGWGSRLETRISKHDTLFDEREKQVLERFDDIVARLDRIERKQDAANGKR